MFDWIFDWIDCEPEFDYIRSHYSKEELPKVLGDVIANQQFAGNPYLYQAPMHIPHRCPDGNGGLAYFAGFRKEE